MEYVSLIYFRISNKKKNKKRDKENLDVDLRCVMDNFLEFVSFARERINEQNATLLTELIDPKNDLL